MSYLLDLELLLLVHKHGMYGHEILFLETLGRAEHKSLYALTPDDQLEAVFPFALLLASHHKA